jgi:hypothetical protein
LAKQGNGAAGALISSAFDHLASNAEKIGQLNITPDLLQALLPKEPPDGKGKSPPSRG